MKTRNRILSIFLAVLVVVSAIPFAFANDGVEIGGQCGENAYWKLDDQGKLTIFGSGEIQKYEYSYNSEGELCTGSIYQNDWWSCVDQIQSVEIQEGITSICCRAFQRCYNLTEVILPDTLERIDAEAFLECNNLHEINIPKSVIIISDTAFAKNQGLYNITVDPENSNYMNDAFGVIFDKSQTVLLRYPSGSLNEEYIIPNTVKRIAPFAFENSYHLRSVTLPDGLITIQEGAFRDCRIQSLTIPASVSVVEAGAFAYNPQLTRIDVAVENPTYSSSESGVLFNESGTTLIQYPCGSELSAYSVPDGTKTIESYAFSGAMYLETVTLPAGLETIEVYAFGNCDSLNRVEIPDSVKRIPSFAFDYCPSLETVLFHSGLQEIGASAFRFAHSLKSISIPETVSKIEAEAFGSCSQLERFIVDANNPVFTSDEYGALLNKNKTVLIQFPAGNDCEEYVVPDTVKTIKRDSFVEAGFASIVLPESLRTIEQKAFVDCDCIKTITIPEGVVILDNFCFYACDQLESLYIPYSVKYFDADAFRDCDNLSDVYFNGTIFEWDDIKAHCDRPINLDAVTMHFNECMHENTVMIPAVESVSCTQLGNTGGKRCTDCGRWLMQPINTIKAHRDETDDGICDLCGAPVAEIQVGEIKEAFLRKNEEIHFQFLPEEDGSYGLEFISFGSSSSVHSWQSKFYDQNDMYVGFDENAFLSAGEVYTYVLRNLSDDIDVPAKFTFKLTKKSSSCGKYISWELQNFFQDDICLQISGCGDMWDYSEQPAPWDNPESIQQIVFNFDYRYRNNEIRSISPEAFAGMTGIKTIFNNHYNLVVSSVFNEIASDFVVHCYKGSPEHIYCKENNIPYVLVGNVSEDEPESLTDEDTGVGITFYPNTFDDEDVTLAVKTIDTQNENARAWSIAPVNDQGEKVQPNQRVQIRLPLPEGWNRMPLLITHTHDDGEIEIISGNNYWFEGDYVVFWVSRFSKFEVTALAPHTHTYISSVTIQPTCTSAGLRTYTCTSCEAGTIGHTYSEPIGAVGHVYGSWTIIKEPSCKEAGLEMHVCVNCLDQRESHPLNALGHIDRDGDGYCDREGCGEMMTGGDRCPQCGKVHNGFFQKIVGFFHKIIYRLTHLFEK